MTFLPFLSLAMPRRCAVVLCMACLGALLLGGCAARGRTAPEPSLLTTGAVFADAAASSATAASAPGAAVMVPPLFSFSPGDEFDVRVPDAPQLDQTLKVRPDGKVSLALVGTLHVQGRSPEDVQAELRERLVQVAGARGGREYLLQPNDEFEVKFPFQPQLNELVRVRPDGKVQLQMAGTVQAEGVSPEALRETLRERYARWLRKPELSVIVRSFATQNVRVAGGNGAPTTGRAGLASLEPAIIVRNFQAPQVFVGGEVLRPGVLPYRAGLSLLQAVVQAGGHLPSGDAAQLLVVRRSVSPATGAEEVRVLRTGFNDKRLHTPDHDFELQPFDIVLLPKLATATLADTLNQYVFNLVPFLRNSSFGFAYNIHGNNNN